MSDAPPLGPGTLLAGKFRIERLLGAGAMGAVYAIEHEFTHNKRALKLLHPALHSVPDLVRRFLNEASAAGRAGNAHLVETFDAGTLPTGEPYLVMELLEGEPLDAILQRERSLDAALATELVAQAAEGIHAAHRAGIVHRDLKPENLFVTTRNGAPFVKILDFGVSKFAAVSADQLRHTRAGMVYGSPAYMSPEQLTAAPDVDPRADVFALGVVLFQSLTGVLPFDGPTLEALALRVLSGTRPDVQTLRPDLPPALVEVVHHALAPLRDNRFPTAEAFAEALSPFRAPAAWPPNEDLGHAATIVSSPPMGSAGPMVAPSIPVGVPRDRRVVPLVAGVAIILVAVAGALVIARVRAPALATSFRSPSALPSAVGIARPVVPEPSAALTLEPATEPAVPSPAPSPPPRALPAAARLASPSATASASARPSAAHNLGLSEDNPFR
jgi:serine/threonine protein kinase